MTLKKRLARLTYPLRHGSRKIKGKPTASKMLQRAKMAEPFLTPIFDNTANIKPRDKILLTMGRDEGARISYFLKYYRELGFDHFLFVDNESTSPMSEQLADQPDVSLWHTTDSYARSKFGVDWMNILLNRYAPDHWALTVDLDEFFVFPLMEIRSFSEFIEYLENCKISSVFSPLIDMYPNGPISDAVVPDGISPLLLADHFDAIGYFSTFGGYEDRWVKGGPRCRFFADGDLERSPTMNKTPLIKWQKGYAYVASTHAAAPYKLNHVHQTQYLGPTGALLHFKFLSNFKDKAEFAVQNKNHYEGSREYAEYLKKLQENEKIELVCPLSVKYEGTKTLIDHGLMTVGLWE